MSRVLDVILTNYGPEFGWNVTCVQLPELVGGRNTDKQLRDDLDEILRFGGMTDGDEIRLHFQAYHLGPDGQEYFIRAEMDDHSQERQMTAHKVGHIATDPTQEQIFDQPQTSTGEIVFVCSVDTDTIDWAIRQTGLDGVVNVVIAHDSDVRVVPLANQHATTADEAEPISELGLTGQSTMADLLKVLEAVLGEGHPIQNRALVLN